MPTEPWGGLLALAALFLWPGLLIVRAPWPFVPFLSLSFWLVSWDWLMAAGPGRQRFLIVVLAFSALFSGLRLFKPLGASRPSGPTLLVLAAALARLAPFFAWPAPPGLDPAFSSASALLLVWRDGLPSSSLPLYPLFGFGLGDSGLASFAADIALLAGLAPHRALLLATLASEGLLFVALFAFARRFWPETGAALAGVTGAALGLLAVARSEVDGGTLLSLAFAVGGASLVLHAQGRSPGVAAGALWAGAAATAPLLAFAGAAATATTIAVRGGGRGIGRLALATVVAALLATPVLWGIADAGGLRMPGLAPVALAFLVVTGIPVAAARGSWPAPKPWLAAALVATAMVATPADWMLRSARVRVSADELAAAAWLRDHSRPTDVVCARDEAARAWIPALAGRATSPPWWPASVRPSRLALPPSGCRFVWGPAGSGAVPATFRQGRVTVTRLPEGAPANGP
jgi:hypothetical protein